MAAVTESITKNRQPIAVLRAMAARAFGDERVPEGDDWVEELGHGWFNVAYRIRLADGEPVVLKIAPPASVEVMTYERDMMRTEVAALELIRARTSVPVPAVLFHDVSRELCDADYFFMEFVHGDNLGIVKDELAPGVYTSCVEAMGAANRDLNQVKGDHFGPLLGTGGGSWREVFGGILEDVLRDGERRDVDLGWDYAVVRSVIAEYADSLDEVTEPAFVEWDLWDTNVMIRDGVLVSIIDHERALYGDPIMEGGFAASELAEFPGDSSDFIRGYGQPPFTEGERRRRRLYGLHLVLVMVIETVYRGHTDLSQYDFARAALDGLMENTFGRRR
ncbi:phosphotransferase family protein [Umezawaea sp. NPDC059074]|uniref:phosphotransferase family protein n=1 Tax=Umezawaea sp. NPDC059074 TaxID=3346716 RepID=UPI003684DBD7